MKQGSAPSSGPNRAKPYQLVLLPSNNDAIDVYHVLVLSYVATFSNVALGLAITFVSIMVTAMRVLDAAIDPIIGALMDKTSGKFSKFRPSMMSGSVIMAASVICLYVLTPFMPANMMQLRYAFFVILYVIWAAGYACQISVTRAAQSVPTSDPKQRPLPTAFNTMDFLLGMGVIQFLGPVLAGDGVLGDYNQTQFAVMTPIGIVVLVVLTIPAIIDTWEKDQPKYFDITGEKTEKVKISEYWEIIKYNNPIQRLVVAGAGCRLILSTVTNIMVLIVFYGCMTGNYGSLYLSMMILDYVFAVPFSLSTVRTAQKKGQKASLVRYVDVALVCYVGMLVLLLLRRQGDPAPNFSICEGTPFGPDSRILINLYVVLFILFFGIGYGAYCATADMPISMVADHADHETHHSSRFIPGAMGTLFALMDKLVSSLSVTAVGLAVNFTGLDALPTRSTPCVPGMNIVIVVPFCIVPTAAWPATLIAMWKYTLTGEWMRQVQAVDSARKEAIAKGTSLGEAMRVTTDETVPK